MIYVMIVATAIAGLMLRTKPQQVPVSSVAPEVCELDGGVKPPVFLYDGLYRVRCRTDVVVYVAAR